MVASSPGWHGECTVLDWCVASWQGGVRIGSHVLALLLSCLPPLPLPLSSLPLHQAYLSAQPTASADLNHKHDCHHHWKEQQQQQQQVAKPCFLPTAFAVAVLRVTSPSSLVSASATPLLPLLPPDPSSFPPGSPFLLLASPFAAVSPHLFANRWASQAPMSSLPPSPPLFLSSRQLYSMTARFHSLDVYCLTQPCIPRIPTVGLSFLALLMTFLFR